VFKLFLIAFGLFLVIVLIALPIFEFFHEGRRAHRRR